MYSEIALKIFTLVQNKTIKSNAMFWRDFSLEKIEKMQIDTKNSEKMLKNCNFDIICAFDEDSPKIELNLKNSERPFLFAYKGNLELLKNISQNIAVIGVLNPTHEIVLREQKIVQTLITNNRVILSGLAKGCDTVAHKTCLENGGKTIATLPCTLDNIYPKENKNLVDEIVKNGGLVITEYVIEPQNRFESVKRFIDRDRLQAMFSKGVILIASFVQGKGDSGSRHAMKKAKEYGKQRFVMFNEKTDNNKNIFELNKNEISDDAKVLTEKTIKDLFN